jgi:hypothetical protein
MASYLISTNADQAWRLYILRGVFVSLKFTGETSEINQFEINQLETNQLEISQSEIGQSGVNQAEICWISALPLQSDYT